MSKMQSCYDLGLEKLVASGQLSTEDAAKWKDIDSKLLSLHRNTKELLWFSKRRISREYASSPDGLGKQPKAASDD